jgi:hypothetical protein
MVLVCVGKNGQAYWALPQLPLAFQLRSGIPLQVLAKFRFRYTWLWAHIFVLITIIRNTYL